MKNYLFLIAICIICSLSSCDSDETCITEAYAIPTNEGSNIFENTNIVNRRTSLDLSSDETYVGDQTFDDVILNGYTLTIIGNVIINNTFEAKASGGTLLVENNIYIANDCKLEFPDAKIQSVQGGITVDNAVIGPGTLQYCTYFNENRLGTPPVNNDPFTEIQECAVTLSVNDVNYTKVEVACNLIGQVKDGYRYIAVE